MSGNFQDSLFSLLPNEVLIEVLKYVDTFTLLNFCEVYECYFFFQERDVVKTIDLSKKYKLQDLSFLSKNIVFEYVNTLNINCLYWIPVATLRKFVAKLVNLKVLYAIKTNLSISSVDFEIYNRTKIEKLGISLRKNDGDDIVGLNKAANIKTLYLNFMSATTLNILLMLDRQFPQLTSLWIDFEEPNSGYPIFHGLRVGFKKKIFCKINVAIPSLNFEIFGLRRYYNNRRACHFYEMCCEALNAKELTVQTSNEINESVREAWKILEELHCAVPFGPRDAKRLYLNEATLDNICFEELNFYHNGPTCNDRCRDSHRQILKSKNAKFIKKLCVMSCTLINEDARRPISLHESNGFKRKRIGLVQTVESHPIEAIFKNFKDLEHLEIFDCQKAYHPSSIQGYPFIGKFEKLQTLLVEIPLTLDGSFLIHVVKNCKQLECLKITALAQHENLNHNICNALPYASSLKDFRYENHRIPLDKLLERLFLIKSKKLERLVLICNEIDKFSAAPLKDLLESNPQLVFLYFLIRHATNNSLKMAQQTLNFYKKQHPAKVFIVKKTEITEIGCLIPNVHLCEMLKFESDVATLRPLEDFISF